MNIFIRKKKTIINNRRKRQDGKHRMKWQEKESKILEKKSKSRI
jgi:hypothetical protein